MENKKIKDSELRRIARFEHLQKLKMIKEEFKKEIEREEKIKSSCRMCGTDISHRRANALFCLKCVKEKCRDKQSEYKRNYLLKHPEKIKAVYRFKTKLLNFFIKKYPTEYQTELQKLKVELIENNFNLKGGKKEK